MKTNVDFDHITFLLRMRNVLDKNFGENKNTYLCTVTFSCEQKLCCLWNNVKKCCRAQQATDDNTAHAYCMLDT